MSTLSKAIIAGLVILLIIVGLFVWKVKMGTHSSTDITHLSKEDMETIFKDAPPASLKRLADDPELKQKQIDQLKEFLAIAQEAREKGFADTDDAKKIAEDIDMTITAVNYDKEQNKDKENLPPFSSITKEQVDAYFQTGDNQAKFDKWVGEQIEQAKKDKKIPDDFNPTPEQLDQAKEQYSKVRISYDAAKANWASLSPEFKQKTELATKLQFAQYLAQKYSTDVLAKQTEVSDEDVNKYLADHPDEAKIFTEKKAKAEEVLKKAKAGEDFGKLAAEYSEDPGSKKNGGLYKDQHEGAMVPEFEKAALALEPGQISDQLVESKYGYHIIKLEKKSVTKDKDGKDVVTYDARHILINLMADAPADPKNPMARPVPLKDKIKNDLQTEKEKKMIDDITARHPIDIATDFVITVPEGADAPPAQPKGMPQLSPEQQKQLEEQMKQLQKQKAAPAKKP